MEVTGTTMATDGEAKGKVTCKVIVGKYYTDTASYWIMGCVVLCYVVLCCVVLCWCSGLD